MARRFTAEPHVPKYQQVIESLSRDILAGKYKSGQKLPSEAALVQQFRTSRITVGRALRELTQRGLVARVAGSGTYVRSRRHAGGGFVFGLLIPDLGHTEIFEPICQGIAGAPRAVQHALLWGHAVPRGESCETEALNLCDQYIERRVSGVFFAPIEMTSRATETNVEILARLDDARIPVILLDRGALPYPQRTRHDLIGIDNRRAAFVAADHLLRLGARRICFLAQSAGAPTVDARIAGFRDALAAHAIAEDDGIVQRLDDITEATIGPLVSARRRFDAFVAVNDRTAGRLMQVLLALAVQIPRAVRIAGIDDVEYASLLPVPLTTVHQPCRAIGEAALGAMLERIEQPHRIPRDILLECRLVVRESCGAAAA